MYIEVKFIQYVYDVLQLINLTNLSIIIQAMKLSELTITVMILLF